MRKFLKPKQMDKQTDKQTNKKQTHWNKEQTDSFQRVVVWDVGEKVKENIVNNSVKLYHDWWLLDLVW